MDPRINNNDQRLLSKLAMVPVDERSEFVQLVIDKLNCPDMKEQAFEELGRLFLRVDLQTTHYRN